MPFIFYEQRPEKFFVGRMWGNPFPTHVHDSVEIIYLTGGTLDMSVGGEKYRLHPGDAAIAFPSIPHGFDAVSKDIDGLSLIFLPEAISEFSSAFRTRIPESPTLAGGALPNEIHLIARKMLELSEQDGEALMHGYLHLFLSYLFCHLRLQPLTTRIQSGLAQQVLHYISEHYTEPLTQASVSRALGISGTHLSHIFCQQLHVNFREYINALRIDRACSLLSDSSLSISQIADMCGFGNSRTFHRAFLARCQMSPNKYRANLFGKEDDR